MEKDYLVSAIKSLRPTAEFSYSDNNYSTIKWDVLEGNAPTFEEIEIEINRLQQEDLIKIQEQAAAKEALLNKLGITAEEAALLLGGN